MDFKKKEEKMNIAITIMIVIVLILAVALVLFLVIKRNSETVGTHGNMNDYAAIGNTAGNTIGGNTIGGNTAGGNTSGGNTAGGNTVGGNTSGGNTVGGNTVGGNTVLPSCQHNYQSSVIDPTCTEEGYTTYTCTKCGDSYEDNYKAAVGHSYGEWTVTKEATCTEKGTKERTCKLCNTGKETEAIDMIAHDYETSVTAPTCTEEGYTTYTCKKCSHSYTDYYKVPVGHSYGEWTVIKESTCTEKGTKERTCKLCNTEKETEAIDMVAHDYETSVTAPTCTEGGYTTYTCKECNTNYIDNYTQATGHSYGEWTVTKEATCTEKGTKERTCKLCNTEKETEAIDMIAHDFKSVVTAPTCTEKGYTTYTCKECDTSYIDNYTNAIGHKYEIKSTTDGICEQGGVIEYECSNCKDTYEEITEAKGHTEVVDARVEATCTATGLTEGKHCSVCEEVILAQEIIPVKEHSYESVVTAPTCTEKGYTTHTCSKCDDNYVDSYVDTIGHSFGAWIIDKEPTYEEEGHKYRVCINCNQEREEEVIPKLIEEGLQVTTTYTVKEQNDIKYIMIPTESTVNEVLKNITANKELKIINKFGEVLEETDLAGTNARVVTKKDNKDVYTIVAKGDANGDAKIDFINDLISFNSYRLNLIELDTASILAGDLDDNGKIEFMADIVKINNHRIRLLNIWGM